MPTLRQGSIHLFKFAGIDLFLHWSWFVVAAFEIQSRAGRNRYSSLTWNVLEYLSLFLIVLMHEFGHALACRQVGGTADKIMLWPLGGVAYVNPPQRPGATLWSIVAGPLVNVVLLPILYTAMMISRSAGWAQTMPDAYTLIRSVFGINIVLLVFNILPIYPLDGGQILRSLLWFVLGRARSLMVATIIGMVGVVAFIGLAVIRESYWLGAIAVFMLMNCWSGLKQARALLRVAKLPRREGFACPSCRTSPPIGTYWGCTNCKQPFDTFESRGICPHCAAQYTTTGCLDCRARYPMNEWVVNTYASSGTVSGGFSTR